MKQFVLVVISLLAGIALGVLWAELGRADLPVPTQSRPGAENPGPSEPPSDPESDPVSPPTTAPQRETVTGDAVDLVTALREYARRELLTGWRQVRDDGMPEPTVRQGLQVVESNTLALPDAVGRNLAEQATAAEAAMEDARTGGAHGLLQEIDDGDAGPLPDLVSDPVAFGKLFPRAAPEIPVVAPESIRTLGQDAQDGATWTFPAGVFEIDNHLESKSPFPRDVTLAGAGMDATLIVLRNELHTQGTMRRFAIRDCTVLTDSNYLFDQRAGTATVLMDRVRVIGFDMGVKSSCVLSCDYGLALYASDCRFEGAYGTSPGSARLFDVRTRALLARFENCYFSTMSVDVAGLRPGATAVFYNCQMVDILNDVRATQTPGIQLIGTQVQMRDPAAGRPLRLDIDDLFPDWRNAMRR